MSLPIHRLFMKPERQLILLTANIYTQAVQHNWEQLHVQMTEVFNWAPDDGVSH